MGRLALMVVGMHRSGTSAAARMLALAGGSLPERLMAAGPDNPEGFWEPWEMVALNDQMLSHAGSRWDDIFIHQADQAIWAERDCYLETARTFISENFGDRPYPILKDPRASAVSRFWRLALADHALSPVYVIMVRHPTEVAKSIAARSGASLVASQLSWAATMAAVERDTRGWPRVFVRYDALLADWRNELSRIELILDQPLPAHSRQMEDEIDSFLSGGLRHHSIGGSDDGLPALVASTWTWMSEASQGREPPPAAMDAVIAELDSLAGLAGPALADLRRELAGYPALSLRCSDLASENANLRALCDRFHGEADRARQAADAAELALAAGRMTPEPSAPEYGLVATGTDDERLVQAWSALARCQIDLVRGKRLRALFAEADRAVYERRKAEAIQDVTERLHAEQSAHSVTQHGLADAHRQLTLAGEAGAALAVTREAAQQAADEAVARAALLQAERDDLISRVAALQARTETAERALAESTAQAANLEKALGVARTAERDATERFASASQRLAQISSSHPDRD